MLYISWLFVALTTLIFALAIPYGVKYLSSYKASVRQRIMHWTMFLVCFAGMMGLYLTDNMLYFLISWEFMAIGSFFAVIFENEKPAVLKAGLNYFVQSHIGVLFLTAAFGWVYASTGSWQIDAVKSFMAGSSVLHQTIWLVMIMIGFGFKAGLVGMHTWLPQAHPAAPSHISALMSGVIVKAGVYGMLRFGYCASHPAANNIGWTILVMGILSAVMGIAQATRQKDIKKMLAYCTIENVGIIFAAMGLFYIGIAEHDVTLMVLGFAAALMHTVNHAIFKVLLFWSAGAVYTQTHTRNMEQLGGLANLMPRTTRLFTIASVGIAGLPPLGSFCSEILLYAGLLHGVSVMATAQSVVMILAGAAIAVVGGAALMCFVRTLGIGFLGTPRKELEHEPKEVGAAMLIPQYILLIPVLAMMLAPHWAFFASVGVLGDLVKSLPAGVFGVVNDTFNLLYSIRNGAMVLTVVMFAVLLFRVIMQKRRPASEGPTWGCGYMKPIEGIQYTATSFSGTFVSLFKVILPETKKTDVVVNEVFPTAKQHGTILEDGAELYVTKPVSNFVLNLLHKMDWLMNGQLQRYIVYGLVTIMVLVLVALL